MILTPQAKGKEGLKQIGEDKVGGHKNILLLLKILPPSYITLRENGAASLDWYSFIQPLFWIKINSQMIRMGVGPIILVSGSQGLADPFAWSQGLMESVQRLSCHHLALAMHKDWRTKLISFILCVRGGLFEPRRDHFLQSCLWHIQRTWSNIFIWKGLHWRAPSYSQKRDRPKASWFYRSEFVTSFPSQQVRPYLQMDIKLNFNSFAGSESFSFVTRILSRIWRDFLKLAMFSKGNVIFSVSRLSKWKERIGT